MHRLLEVLDVGAHRLGRALAVAVADRLEQRAMLLDGLLELVRAIERDRPDAQREHVVLLERRLEQVVVRRAVDGAVDPLVEVDQLAAAGVELREQQRRAPRRSASVARSAASRAASGSSTARTSESRASSRTSTPVTNIPRRG